MPFTEFTNYLTLEKNYSEHTVMAYMKDLSSFAEFASEGYELDSVKEVSYAIVRSWIVSLVNEGISNRSINRKVSSLKSYYKFLMKTKQIEVSPLTKHKALKTSKKIQVPFSEKEIDDVLELLKEAEGFEGIRNKLIVELFYSTGMRRTELVNLKYADVSIAQRTLKVLGKRNKERIIPLLSSVVSTIEDYFKARKKLEVIEDEDFLLLSVQKALKYMKHLFTE